MARDAYSLSTSRVGPWRAEKSSLYLTDGYLSERNEVNIKAHAPAKKSSCLISREVNSGEETYGDV
jgi:hypothetical protein